METRSSSTEETKMDKYKQKILHRIFLQKKKMYREMLKKKKMKRNSRKAIMKIIRRSRSVIQPLLKKGVKGFPVKVALRQLSSQCTVCLQRLSLEEIKKYTQRERRLVSRSTKDDSTSVNFDSLSHKCKTKITKKKYRRLQILSSDSETDNETPDNEKISTNLLSEIHQNIQSNKSNRCYKTECSSSLEQLENLPSNVNNYPVKDIHLPKSKQHDHNVSCPDSKTSKKCIPDQDKAPDDKNYPLIVSTKSNIDKNLSSCSNKGNHSRVPFDPTYSLSHLHERDKAKENNKLSEPSIKTSINQCDQRIISNSQLKMSVSLPNNKLGNVLGISIKSKAKKEETEHKLFHSKTNPDLHDTQKKHAKEYDGPKIVKVDSVTGKGIKCSKENIKDVDPKMNNTVFVKHHKNNTSGCKHTNDSKVCQKTESTKLQVNNRFSSGPMHSKISLKKESHSADNLNKNLTNKHIKISSDTLEKLSLFKSSTAEKDQNHHSHSFDKTDKKEQKEKEDSFDLPIILCNKAYKIPHLEDKNSRPKGLHKHKDDQQHDPFKKANTKPKEKQNLKIEKENNSECKNNKEKGGNDPKIVGSVETHKFDKSESIEFDKSAEITCKDKEKGLKSFSLNHSHKKTNGQNYLNKSYDEKLFKTEHKHKFDLAQKERKRENVEGRTNKLPKSISEKDSVYLSVDRRKSAEDCKKDHITENEKINSKERITLREHDTDNTCNEDKQDNITLDTRTNNSKSNICKMSPEIDPDKKPHLSNKQRFHSEKKTENDSIDKIHKSSHSRKGSDVCDEKPNVCNKEKSSGDNKFDIPTKLDKSKIEYLKNNSKSEIINFTSTIKSRKDCSLDDCDEKFNSSVKERDNTSGSIKKTTDENKRNDKTTDVPIPSKSKKDYSNEKQHYKKHRKSSTEDKVKDHNRKELHIESNSTVVKNNSSTERRSSSNDDQNNTNGANIKTTNENLVENKNNNNKKPSSSKPKKTPSSNESNKKHHKSRRKSSGEVKQKEISNETEIHGMITKNNSCFDIHDENQKLSIHTKESSSDNTNAYKKTTDENKSNDKRSNISISSSKPKQDISTNDGNEKDYCKKRRSSTEDKQKDHNGKELHKEIKVNNRIEKTTSSSDVHNQNLKLPIHINQKRSSKDNEQDNTSGSNERKKETSTNDYNEKHYKKKRKSLEGSNEENDINGSRKRLKIENFVKSDITKLKSVTDPNISKNIENNTETQSTEIKHKTRKDSVSDVSEEKLTYKRSKSSIDEEDEVKNNDFKDNRNNNSSDSNKCSKSPVNVSTDDSHLNTKRRKSEGNDSNHFKISDEDRKTQNLDPIVTNKLTCSIKIDSVMKLGNTKVHLSSSQRRTPTEILTNKDIKRGNIKDIETNCKSKTSIADFSSSTSEPNSKKRQISTPNFINDENTLLHATNVGSCTISEFDLSNKKIETETSVCNDFFNSLDKSCKSNGGKKRKISEHNLKNSENVSFQINTVVSDSVTEDNLSKNNFEEDTVVNNETISGLYKEINIENIEGNKMDNSTSNTSTPGTLEDESSLNNKERELSTQLLIKEKCSRAGSGLETGSKICVKETEKVTIVDKINSELDIETICQNNLKNDIDFHKSISEDELFIKETEKQIILNSNINSVLDEATISLNNLKNDIDLCLKTSRIGLSIKGSAVNIPGERKKIVEVEDRQRNNSNNTKPQESETVKENLINNQRDHNLISVTNVFNPINDTISPQTEKIKEQNLTQTNDSTSTTFVVGPCTVDDSNKQEKGVLPLDVDVNIKSILSTEDKIDQNINSLNSESNTDFSLQDIEKETEILNQTKQVKSGLKVFDLSFDCESTSLLKPKSSILRQPISICTKNDTNTLENKINSDTVHRKSTEKQIQNIDLPQVKNYPVDSPTKNDITKTYEDNVKVVSIAETVTVPNQNSTNIESEASKSPRHSKLLVPSIVNVKIAESIPKEQFPNVCIRNDLNIASTSKDQNLGCRKFSDVRNVFEQKSDSQQNSPKLQNQKNNLLPRENSISNTRKMLPTFQSGINNLKLYNIPSKPVNPKGTIQGKFYPNKNLLKSPTTPTQKKNLINLIGLTAEQVKLIKFKSTHDNSQSPTASKSLNVPRKEQSFDHISKMSKADKLIYNMNKEDKKKQIYMNLFGEDCDESETVNNTAIKITSTSRKEDEESDCGNKHRSDDSCCSVLPNKSAIEIQNKMNRKISSISRKDDEESDCKNKQSSENSCNSVFPNNSGIEIQSKMNMKITSTSRKEDEESDCENKHRSDDSCSSVLPNKSAIEIQNKMNMKISSISRKDDEEFLCENEQRADDSCNSVLPNKFGIEIQRKMNMKITSTSTSRKEDKESDCENKDRSDDSCSSVLLNKSAIEVQNKMNISSISRKDDEESDCENEQRADDSCNSVLPNKSGIEIQSKMNISSISRKDDEESDCENKQRADDSCNSVLPNKSGIEIQSKMNMKISSISRKDDEEFDCGNKDRADDSCSSVLSNKSPIETQNKMKTPSLQFRTIQAPGKTGNKCLNKASIIKVMNQLTADANKFIGKSKSMSMKEKEMECSKEPVNSNEFYNHVLPSMPSIDDSVSIQDFLKTLDGESCTVHQDFDFQKACTLYKAPEDTETSDPKTSRTKQLSCTLSIEGSKVVSDLLISRSSTLPSELKNIHSVTEEHKDRSSVRKVEKSVVKGVKSKASKIHKIKKVAMDEMFNVQKRNLFSDRNESVSSKIKLDSSTSRKVNTMVEKYINGNNSDNLQSEIPTTVLKNTENQKQLDSELNENNIEETTGNNKKSAKNDSLLDKTQDVILDICDEAIVSSSTVSPEPVTVCNIETNVYVNDESKIGKIRVKDARELGIQTRDDFCPSQINYLRPLSNSNETFTPCNTIVVVPKENNLFVDGQVTSTVPDISPVIDVVSSSSGSSESLPLNDKNSDVQHVKTLPVDCTVNYASPVQEVNVTVKTCENTKSNTPSSDENCLKIEEIKEESTTDVNIEQNMTPVRSGEELEIASQHNEQNSIETNVPSNRNNTISETLPTNFEQNSIQMSSRTNIPSSQNNEQNYVQSHSSLKVPSNEQNHITNSQSVTVIPSQNHVLSTENIEQNKVQETTSTRNKEYGHVLWAPVENLSSNPTNINSTSQELRLDIFSKHMINMISSTNGDWTKNNLNCARIYNAVFDNSATLICKLAEILHLVITYKEAMIPQISKCLKLKSDSLIKNETNRIEKAYQDNVLMRGKDFYSLFCDIYKKIVLNSKEQNFIDLVFILYIKIINDLIKIDTTHIAYIFKVRKIMMEMMNAIGIKNLVIYTLLNSEDEKFIRRYTLVKENLLQIYNSEQLRQFLARTSSVTSTVTHSDPNPTTVSTYNLNHSQSSSNENQPVTSSPHINDFNDAELVDLSSPEPVANIEQDNVFLECNETIKNANLNHYFGLTDMIDYSSLQLNPNKRRANSDIEHLSNMTHSLSSSRSSRNSNYVDITNSNKQNTNISEINLMPSPQSNPAGGIVSNTYVPSNNEQMGCNSVNNDYYRSRTSRRNSEPTYVPASLPFHQPNLLRGISLVENTPIASNSTAPSKTFTNIHQQNNVYNNPTNIIVSQEPSQIQTHTNCRNPNQPIEFLPRLPSTQSQILINQSHNNTNQGSIQAQNNQFLHPSTTNNNTLAYQEWLRRNQQAQIQEQHYRTSTSQMGLQPPEHARQMYPPFNYTNTSLRVGRPPLHPANTQLVRPPMFTAPNQTMYSLPNPQVGFAQTNNVQRCNSVTNVPLPRQMCYFPLCNNPATKHCNTCNKVFYCSNECQKKDWKHQHYLTCI